MYFFKSQFTLRLQLIILDAFKFPLHNYHMESGNKFSLKVDDSKTHNKDVK